MSVESVGATRFTLPMWWAAVVLFVPMAIALSATALGLDLLFDGPRGWPDVDLMVDLALPVTGGVIGGAVGMGMGQRRRWLTVSDAGIEIAEHGVPILVEWSNITNASVRRRGPFARLEVVPTDLRLVRQVGSGARAPVVRQVAAGWGFQFDVGMFWPTPDVLRAALASHAPRP